jgi:DNA-binding CsgD family transcriptional regulator
LRQARDLAVPRGVASVLLNLADAYRRLGDHARGVPLLTEAMEIGRTHGDHLALGMALYNLAGSACQHGDLPRAWELGRESLTLLQGLGRKKDVADCLELLGGLLAMTGLPTEAARLLGSAAEVREATGTESLNAQDVTRSIATVRAALAEPAFAAAWEEGRALTLEQALAETGTLTSRFLAALGGSEAAKPDEPSLTPREREVLGLVAEGRTDREIAALHGTSPRTVSVHVGQILAKLGVPTRAAAAATAVRRGLI